MGCASFFRQTRQWPYSLPFPVDVRMIRAGRLQLRLLTWAHPPSAHRASYRT